MVTFQVVLSATLLVLALTSPIVCGEEGVDQFGHHPLSQAPHTTSSFRKRSAYGLFGLATKRPNKAAISYFLTHPRPHMMDTFIPVRGRRWDATSPHKIMPPKNDALVPQLYMTRRLLFLSGDSSSHETLHISTA
ncbi:hypothetical protein Fcan01_14277 [Folsomia candida]|uniref:Secreted protein n=1 Tax=Folsomia candida TaxID=158441 RepID=A0A226E1P4_FOLCA|nr:hypothetical protein Fcan01_14277 [Folsomia candida]